MTAIVLASEPHPSGLTRITVATGPATTVIVSVPTATAHQLSDHDLDQLVAAAVATERPPVRRR